MTERKGEGIIDIGFTVIISTITIIITTVVTTTTIITDVSTISIIGVPTCSAQ